MPNYPFANWQDGTISYRVQANPNVIPYDQIKGINIVAKDGYKQPEPKQESATQGSPEFEANERLRKAGIIK